MQRSGRKLILATAVASTVFTAAFTGLVAASPVQDWAGTDDEQDDSLRPPIVGLQTGADVSRPLSKLSDAASREEIRGVLTGANLVRPNAAAVADRSQHSGDGYSSENAQANQPQRTEAGSLLAEHHRAQPGTSNSRATGLPPEQWRPAVQPVLSPTVGSQFPSVELGRTRIDPVYDAPPHRHIEDTLEGDPSRPYIHVLGDEGPLLDSPPTIDTVPSAATPAESDVEIPELREVPLAEGPTYSVEALLDPRFAARGAGDQPGTNITTVKGETQASHDDGGSKRKVGVTGKIVTTVNDDGSLRVSVTEGSTEKQTSGIDLGLGKLSSTNSQQTKSTTTYGLSADTVAAVENLGPLPTYNPFSMQPGDSITTVDAASRSNQASGSVGRSVRNVGLEAGISLTTSDGEFETTKVARTDANTMAVFTGSGTSHSETASVDGSLGAGKVASTGMRDSNTVASTEYEGLRTSYDVGTFDTANLDELEDYAAQVNGNGLQLDPRDNFQTVRGKTSSVKSVLSGQVKAAGAPAGASVESGNVYWEDKTKQEHTVTLQTPTGNVEDAIPMHAGTSVTRSSTGGQFVHSGMAYPDVDVKVSSVVDPGGHFAENIELKVGPVETHYTNGELKDAARNLAQNDPEAARNPVVQSILGNASMASAFTGRGENAAPTSSEIADAARALSTQGSTGTYDEAPVISTPTSVSPAQSNDNDSGSDSDNDNGSGNGSIAPSGSVSTGSTGSGSKGSAATRSTGSTNSTGSSSQGSASSASAESGSTFGGGSDYGYEEAAGVSSANYGASTVSSTDDFHGYDEFGLW